VAIARALLNQPAILMADEPTGNLDFNTGNDVLELIWSRCVSDGQTAILATHDARAAAYADRVLVMRDGRIIDSIELGRRQDHSATPLIARLAQLGL
jgi:putative ABC transport system ATP-binding protein